MAVWALGINHTTAPLDLRGKFAFALDQITPTLQGLRQSLGQSSRHNGVETAIISTCNRTEIYCAGEQAAMDHTLGWLAQSGGVSPALLRSHSYTLEDSLVARHAFRGARGLGSMVLGEAQILGQMKNAVRPAEGAGALGTTLNQLFQRSFAVAKEVRTSTEIGAHSISMAAAAVRLAGQLFEDLSEIRVLFVGAGEMIELAATHFAARNPQSIAIANRTLGRGGKVATRFGGGGESGSKNSTLLPCPANPAYCAPFLVAANSPKANCCPSCCETRSRPCSRRAWAISCPIIAAISSSLSCSCRIIPV